MQFRNISEYVPGLSEACVAVVVTTTPDLERRRHAGLLKPQIERQCHFGHQPCGRLIVLAADDLGAVMMRGGGRSVGGRGEGGIHNARL